MKITKNTSVLTCDLLYSPKSRVQAKTKILWRECCFFLVVIVERFYVKLVQNFLGIGCEMMQTVSKLKAGALLLFCFLSIRKLTHRAVLCIHPQ